MINFLFTTKQYEDEAKRHSLSKEAQKIKERLARTPNYEPGELYRSFPGNYYKVRFSNLRLILTRKDERINDKDVRIYVALRVLKRDSNEYERFHTIRTSESERDTISCKSSLDWDVYIQKVRDHLTKPVVEVTKPNLTDAEMIFVSTRLEMNHKLFEDTIYETEEWIKDIQNSEFNDYDNAREEIDNCILANIDSGDGWHIQPFKKNAILLYHDKQNWVLDRILPRNDNDNYAEYLEKQAPADYKRGYPYGFLKDPDDWREMELDSKSNLVLSQQQVNLVSKDIPFPLFLTGRAGSGKSTMLQYLFTEIVLKYVYTLKEYNETINKPLYISYSKELVDDAKKLCRTLFEKNNVYSGELKKYGIDYRTDINPILDSMFLEFDELLSSCAKKLEESSIRFKEADFFSYPQFNREWNKRFGKIPDAAKKYGPSISWHVIRTYIKGWNYDEFMTPEYYETIGNDNQTVRPETFRCVYEQVWPWYSKIDGAWDEQDIVRFCLNNNLVDERFSAIFCDESQDFTRIEIDFILRLSSFSNRNLLSVNDIKKLPFVFAGDEFQTLNPTGFSWSILRSYFTERLRDLTNLSQYGKELGVEDPIELSENFRSTQEIVRLANRIQLLRASRLDHYSDPQTSHFSKEGSLITCVPATQAIIDEFREKDVAIIAPFGDEPVKEYIENSGLKGYIKYDDNGDPDINILNPMQAKGIEYPNVAVYGFHNDGILIDNLLNWFKNPNSIPEEDIELKYQISNAYVAVTRATSNLYIIDSFNEDSFWAFAFNSEDPVTEEKIGQLQDAMLIWLKEKQRNNWKESELGWIEDNRSGSNISDENVKYQNTVEHRQNLEKNAKDPYVLRMAARLNKRNGDRIGEARCYAKAYEMSGNYQQAAECYVKAEEYDDAINAFWSCLSHQHQKSIIGQIAKLKPYSQDVRVSVCDKCEKPSVRNFELALNETIKGMEHNKIEDSETWQFVLNYLLANINARKKEGLSDIPKILTECQQLLKYDIEINLSKLASMTYAVGAMKEAISLWEKMEIGQRPKEYYIAKLNTLKYPETIEYYEGASGEHWMEELHTIYRQNPDTKLNERQKRIIATVVNSKGNREEFLQFLPFMLFDTQNIETSNKVLDDADKFECDINKPVITSLIETRFTDLHTWKRSRVKYANPEVSILFDAIELIKRMRKDDFVNFIDRSLQPKDMRVIDFCKQYNTFSRKAVSILVFAELGKRFEERDSFIDAIRYYEWAKNQSDDETFKRAMDLRWIVCKERQAAYEKDESAKKAVYTKEAIDKRRDLQIPLDEKLDLDLVHADYWESVFEFYTKINNEQVVETKKREKKVETKTKEPKTTPSTDRSKLKKQELRYNDYYVNLFPGKGDVVIRDKENDYQVRIKEGVFPDSGDFILKDSRVYVSENDTPTPFVFEKNENNLVIKIFEDDIDTGLSIVVNLK